MGPLVPPRRRRGDGGRQHDAAADGAPLLQLSRVDKGRVALLLSDQLWLWARGYDGGGPHLDLLRRLAHWLMKEPELEEEALRAARARPRHHDRAAEPEGRDAAGDAHRPGRQDAQAAARPGRAGPLARARHCRQTTASIAPTTANMSRWSMSAPTIRWNSRKCFRRPKAAPARRGDRRRRLRLARRPDDPVSVPRLPRCTPPRSMQGRTTRV